MLDGELLYNFCMTLDLYPRITPGATVEPLPEDGWRLSIPAGPGGVYRWAQLDDYMQRSRRDFLWQAPLTLDLEARVSAEGLPGTWGFGLWNDPFSASLGIGGTSRRLPLLPNTAWFFYGSPRNSLSFRDDVPANGLLAATFRSPLLPLVALAPALIGLPLALLPFTARLLRRLAGRVIRGDAAGLEANPTTWHRYRLEWSCEQARFSLDGRVCLETPFSPRGRLGLVLWIDNQYAAFPSNGRIAFGTEVSPAPAWLEVRGVRIN